MRKIIAVLALAVATVAFAPRSVAAQGGSCTFGYMQCLNDTWMLEGWAQKMADIECFAEYAGCLKRIVVD
jgi:hypothetical protein